MRKLTVQRECALDHIPVCQLTRPQTEPTGTGSMGAGRADHDRTQDFKNGDLFLSHIYTSQSSILHQWTEKLQYLASELAQKALRPIMRADLFTYFLSVDKVSIDLFN